MHLNRGAGTCHTDPYCKNYGEFRPVSHFTANALGWATLSCHMVTMVRDGFIRVHTLLLVVVGLRGRLQRPVSQSRG